LPNDVRLLYPRQLSTRAQLLKLTKEKIVDEAIALLHERGLKQVTLRNLADRVDMKAPSLFWYIKNKDELLCLIDETIFRQCVESIPTCGTWQEWMHAYGISIWEAQSKAPDIPNLITQVNLSDQTRETLFELIRDKLSVFELDIKTAMKIQASVQALITGWTVLTNARHAERRLKKEFSPNKEDVSSAMDVLISGWETKIQHHQAPLGSQSKPIKQLA